MFQAPFNVISYSITGNGNAPNYFQLSSATSGLVVVRDTLTRDSALSYTVRFDPSFFSSLSYTVRFDPSFFSSLSYTVRFDPSFFSSLSCTVRFDPSFFSSLSYTVRFDPLSFPLSPAP